jgi:capsular exopolysaccharide synthesis family protein
MQSVTPDNPVMKKTNDEIGGLRLAINASINSVEQGLATKRKDLLNQSNLYSGKIGSMPSQERHFVDLSREQQIKANLFLMLLQKREENALALAAVANKAKVLDEATLESKVAPRTMMVLLAALLIGLLLPVAIIYLKELLQYRIQTHEDVEKLSKIPLLGEIPRSNEKDNIIVKENATKGIVEAFRIIRTSLMLALGSDKKVVVFTSTVSGEGKTFVALNTAISLALLNKKVLLIELDLRIPRVRQYINLEARDGVTNYLSGFEKNIDKLIVPSGINDCLFILPAGPIPPNPAELLSRETLDSTINWMRKEYDYIIIDSPPVSQVADTLIINRVTDATVYVCRADYTSKDSIRFANEVMEQGKLKNMLLVVNDVKDFRRYDYRYGYGYRHNYRYGYGDQKHKIRKHK